MRKKDLLTAAICVTLTLFIIGIVVKGGNKQHPDVLHKSEKHEMDEMKVGMQLHLYRLYLEQEKQRLTFEQETEEVETLELDDLAEEVEVAEEDLEAGSGDLVHETEHEQTERSTPPAQENQSNPGDASSERGQRKSENNGGKHVSENKDPPPADRDDDNKDKPKDKDSTKPAAPENEEQELEPEDVEETDPETEKDPRPDDDEEDEEELEE